MTDAFNKAGLWGAGGAMTTEEESEASGYQGRGGPRKNLGLGRRRTPLRLLRRKKVSYWEMGAGRELGVSAALTASNWPKVIA